MDAASSVCEYLGSGSLAGLNYRRGAQELAALVEHAYSMTWSARRRSDCGIVRPSAFTVFELITRSKVVGPGPLKDLIHVDGGAAAASCGVRHAQASAALQPSRLLVTPATIGS
jgi:hypothetical protein